MEMAPNGELFAKLSEEGPYKESQAKFIFTQISSAVQYMVITHEWAEMSAFVWPLQFYRYMVIINEWVEMSAIPASTSLWPLPFN